MKKRVISLLLSLALLLSLMPAGFAPQAEAAAVTAGQTLAQRREAAFEAMMNMATTMWRATEDVTYTFATSTANIVKGRLYRGLPYTYARGSLDTFLDFAEDANGDGIYEISGLTTHHLDGSSASARIGMDCSGAANAAYGAIGASVKIAGSSTMTPVNGYLRVGLDKYVTPPSVDTNSNDSEVCTANGEQVMYSVYAQALKADLWVCSGHTMMNNYVNVVYAEDGTIDGEASNAIIVHQTPAYIRNESYYTSGTYSEANYGEKVYKCFGINEKKSFKWLYDNGYMPVTCAELVDVNAVPQNATLTDTETDYDFHNILKGTLHSNRMINSVTIAIRDEQDRVVQQATGYSVRAWGSGTNSDLKYDLSQFARENPEKFDGYLNLALLGVGNYHCTTTCRLRTGEVLTARDFDFEVTEANLWEGWVDNSDLSGTDEKCPVCKTAVTWEPLSQITAATALEGGHYYLTEDLTNTSYYNVKNGTACVHLNGHNITSESMAFRIGSGTLKLMGNGKVAGSYVDSSSKYGSTIYLQSSSAKVYLYGGRYGHTAATTQATIGMNIDGAYVAMYDGATLCRMNGAGGAQVNVRKGSFEMFGGLITDGDNRKNYGGNIIIGDNIEDKASFTMHDGIITDGKANHGGNVYLNGENTSFIMNDGLLYFGFAGYITKDGMGGNIYMPAGGTLQLDGTVTYGKSYAGGGNLYIRGGMTTIDGVVEQGNGDYAAATGKSGGNINLGGSGQLTITGTVRDNLSEVSYGGNIFSSASTVTIDGGTVSGGKASSRGGNVYMTSTNVTMLLKNGGSILNGTAANGGNIATNSATAVITLEKGTVTGGTASTGENIRLHAAATLNIKDAQIDGGVYAATGKVNLSGSAQVVGKNGALTDNIYISTGKLQVDNNWTGKASVKWSTAYTYGDTLPVKSGQCGTIGNSFTAGNSYTGTLVYEDIDNRPAILGVDGNLVIAAAQVVGSDTAKWVADNESAVAQVSQDQYIKLYTAKELDLGNKSVYVDFNGQSTVSVNAGEGKLYGFDSTASSQAAGSGVASVTGAAQEDVTTPGGDRYIAITGENGITFHKLDMEITAVALKTGTGGLYYYAKWHCDEILEKQIDAFGIATQLEAVPNDLTSRDVLYSTTDGENFAADTEITGATMNNIISTTPIAGYTNDQRGQMKVYAVPYVTLKSGTSVLGVDACGWSLKDCCDAIDDMITQLAASESAEDQAAAASYTAYMTNLFDVVWAQMGLSWEFDNFPASAE